MAPDAINGVSKVVVPPVPGAAKPPAAAPAAEAGAQEARDASWVGKVGDVLGGATGLVAAPSMAALAAAAVSPLSGLGEMVARAVRVWTKASQVRTQAFLDATLPTLSPAGRQALQALAAQGKLEAVDPGWSNLRDNVDAHLKGGGDRAIVEAVLAQLARPEGTVVQAREHACVAAAFQLGIARDNPAQYFQMATALAAGRPAALPSGEAIAVSPANLAWIEAQGLPPAERLNAIFQAALMDYASGGGYDIASDLVTTRDEEAKLTTTMHGLRPAQARKLNDALLQVPTLDGPGLFARIAAAVGYGDSPLEAATESLVTAVAEAVEGGHGGVMVVVAAGHEAIDLPPGLRNQLPPEDRVVPRFHMVLVKGLEDGRVTYVDPAGQTRTEPLEAFAARICLDEGVYVGTGGTYGTGASTSGTRPPRR